MLFLLVSVEIDKSTLPYKTQKKTQKKYYYKIWLFFSIRDFLVVLSRKKATLVETEGEAQLLPHLSNYLILFFSELLLDQSPFITHSQLPALSKFVKPEAGLVQTDCIYFRCSPPSSSRNQMFTVSLTIYNLPLQLRIIGASN